MKKIRSYYQEKMLPPGLKKYFFNTGWMFTEKILRLVSGLFVGALVARYLGPAQYGLLNYALSLISLFAVIASFGLETIVIRELVRDQSKKVQILGTAFYLRLVGAAIVTALAVTFISLTHHDEITRSILFIISATIIIDIFGVFDYFFQSRVEARYVVISQIASLVIISIFRVVLVANEAPLIWFAFSYVLDPLVIAVGLVFFGKKKGDISPKDFVYNNALARSLLINSWPLILSALAISVYMKIDQIMIKWLISDSANGMYGVAVRLSEMWNFVPVAICASVFPAILNAREIDRTLYENRLQSLYDFMVGLALIVAIFMTFASSIIVQILFGDTYSEASDILTIYVWSAVFVFLGVANGKWIIAENLQIFRMKSLVIAGVINVVLNFILIERVGLKGAAVATLISYAYASYFSLLFTAKTFPTFVASTRAFNPLRFIRLLRAGTIK